VPAILLERILERRLATAAIAGGPLGIHVAAHDERVVSHFGLDDQDAETIDDQMVNLAGDARGNLKQQVVDDLELIGRGYPLKDPPDDAFALIADSLRVVVVQRISPCVVRTPTGGIGRRAEGVERWWLSGRVSGCPRVEGSSGCAAT